MNAKITSGQVKIAFGYFFVLYNCRDTDVESFPVETDDWVLAGSPDGLDHGRCVVEAYQTRLVHKPLCSTNPQHCQVEEQYDYEIDLINMRLPLPPFVSEFDHVIVNGWLAGRLRESNLTGFRLLPTQIFAYPSRYQVSANHDTEMFQLCFDGKSPDARRYVEPPEANRCPFCDFAPMVCPDCGKFDFFCPQCSRRWNVPASLHEGSQDERVAIETICGSTPVIDPYRWDGTDFMGSSQGGYITRRALEWLTSNKAGPFIAQPVAVNILGLSETDFLRLERARSFDS